MAETKLQTALEAVEKYMTVEANTKCEEGPGKDFEPEPPDKPQIEEQNQRLDAIYDDEPLGFEKDPLSDNIKMLAQDPLEEIDLGVGGTKRPTYISVNLDP